MGHILDTSESIFDPLPSQNQKTNLLKKDQKTNLSKSNQQYCYSIKQEAQWVTYLTPSLK